MPDETYKYTLHFCDAHIHMLDDAPVEHSRWHVPTTALLLQGLETPEDDSFVMGEAVSYIRHRVMGIMRRHGRLSMVTQGLDSSGRCITHGVSA